MEPEQPASKIIGLGSWMGDDTIGWKVIDALGALKPPHAIWNLEALDKPGLQLLHDLDPSTPTLLIDALLAPSPQGSLWVLQPEHLKTFPATYSSHGIELADTLVLARLLNRLPHHLFILGIVIQTLAASNNSTHITCETTSPKPLDPYWIAQWTIQRFPDFFQQ
jgi:hydrogenase maturation protease